MKVAVIFNKEEIKESDVIYRFGMPTKERYKPKTIEMVASALEAGGHNVRIFEGNKQVITDLENFMPRVVAGERQGMIFNMAYGIQGQSRYTHIPAMLEMLGLPYVGSAPASHALALDKVLSKIIFLRYNLPTPEYWVFSNTEGDFSEVKYPAIVKPKMEAVSFGIRIITNEKDLKEAIDFIITEFQQQALVERFIPGREFAVALLGNGNTLETLPIVEIDLNDDPNGIQTFDEKMNRPRQKFCPANIDKNTADRLNQLARDAFNSLGLYDFSRVDFRVDKDGNIYILEINSMASLNPAGSFVLSGKVDGMPFDNLVNKMLDVAALRYFGESIKKDGTESAKIEKKPEKLSTRVRSYLRGNLSTIIDYIDQMVSTNSFVYNIEGINTLGNWISNRFQQLGFYRQVIPQTEVGNSLYFANHTEETNDVLLLSHLDIQHDYREFVPFREDRGRLYGSGVAENKGGIAEILAALHALRFTRVLKSVKCGVLLTSDYFLCSKYTKDKSRDIINKSKHIIGLLHSDLQGNLTTSCMGMQEYQVEFNNNKFQNGMQNPDLISFLIKKISSWKKLSASLDEIKMLTTSIEAYEFDNSISDYAKIKMVIHFKDKNLGQSVDEQIIKIAKSSTNGKIQVHVRKGGGRLPMVESKASHKFFKKIQKIGQKMEVRVNTAHFHLSTDASLASDNIPVIEGFGPLANNFGSQDEYIIRDSLIDRSALLAMVIYHCSNQTNE